MLVVLNMRVKVLLLQSLSLETERRTSLLTFGKLGNYWGNFYLDAEVNIKNKTRYAYFMTKSYCK